MARATILHRSHDGGASARETHRTHAHTDSHGIRLNGEMRKRCERIAIDASACIGRSHFG